MSAKAGLAHARTSLVASVRAELESNFKIAVRAGELSSNLLPCEAERSAVPALLGMLAGDLGGRLALVTASDDREITRAFSVYWIVAFDGAGIFVLVRAKVGEHDPTFPSVARALPAAHAFEREIGEMFGLAPLGHPDPGPLLIGDAWPAGVYPMRASIDPAVQRLPLEDPGEGALSLGALSFRLDGDRVRDLALRHGRDHRGIEKRLEALERSSAGRLVERTSGDTAIGHALAWATWVESVSNGTPSPRARAIRSIALEIERAAVHASAIARQLDALGATIPARRAERAAGLAREALDVMSGSRFGFGFVVPGGVRHDLDAEVVDHVLALLDGALEGLEACERLCSATPSVDERLESLAPVGRDVVRLMGVVGPIARASGVDIDARRDHPHAAFDVESPAIATGRGCDARARRELRYAEARASLGFVRRSVVALPAGPTIVAVSIPTPYRAALACVEGARGEILHFGVTSATGRVLRYAIRDPSYLAWRAALLACDGLGVDALAPALASFDLSCAGTDR